MKKIYIVLICLVFLLVTGCKNEDDVTGDIMTNHNNYLMSETKELDILNYHIKIKSINEGMSFNNT